MKSLHEFRSHLVSQLKKSPEAEAELILYSVFRKRIPTIRKYSDLIHKNLKIDQDIQAEASEILDMRCKGVPLQHLLGFQYFYEHEYIVGDSVLIPRPETEILVKEAITWSQNKVLNSPKTSRFNFAELGLGSGVVSIELLSAIPQSVGAASEVSINAIATAMSNLENIIGINWAQRFKIIEPESNLTGFECLQSREKYDLVISNPPYLCQSDEIDEEVLYSEPKVALFPEKDPNYFYLNFLEHAESLLTLGGAVFFEIPHERANYLNEFYLRSKKFSEVSILNDLTGRPRVLKAVR